MSSRKINSVIRFDHTIKAAVELHLPDVDWRLYKAQLWQESELKPDAVSPVGAQGLGQIMPGTFKQFAPGAGYPDADPFDPDVSIMVGAYIMKYLINEWSWPRPKIDRLCLALASYNAGIGHILNAQLRQGNPSMYRDIIQGLPLVTGPKSRETIRYVKKILYHFTEIVVGN